MENLIILKLKDMIRNNWIIFLLIFGLLLIYSSYQIYLKYSSPSFEDKNITVSSYTEYGNYSYSTLVSKQNPLYSSGTILDMNESAYYFATSPVPSFSFVYRLNASNSVNITAMPKVSIVAMRKESNNDNSKILWHKEYPITSVGSIGPFIINNKNGIDNFTYNFTFNAAAIENNVENTQDRLDYSLTHISTYYASNMEYRIKAVVDYNGTINEKQVENTTSFVLPMTMTKSYYELSNDVSTNIINYDNKTISVQKPFTVESIKNYLALMLISVVAIIGIIYCRIIYTSNSIYMAKLEQEKMHSQFKEFISNGKIPEDRSSLMTIEIASLQELINTAVDMNERVIYDSLKNIYFTIHNGVLYYFTKTNLIDETKTKSASNKLTYNEDKISSTSFIEPSFKNP